MAYLYANDGDQIEIQRRVYRVREHRSGEFVLDIVPILCAGCEENDVDEKGDFCPSCIHLALTFRQVQFIVDNVGEFDVPLARTIAHLDAQDAEMRNSGMSYVDSESSACDMFNAEDENGVRNLFAEFIEQVAIPAVMARRVMHQ